MLNYILNHFNSIVRKKKIEGEKKMTQALKEAKEILSPEVKEIAKIEVKEPTKSEVDELLGDLNPRYFEEVSSLKEAKQRIFSSITYAGSKFNIFNAY